MSMKVPTPFKDLYPCISFSARTQKSGNPQTSRKPLATWKTEQISSIENTMIWQHRKDLKVKTHRTKHIYNVYHNIISNKTCERGCQCKHSEKTNHGKIQLELWNPNPLAMANLNLTRHFQSFLGVAMSAGEHISCTWVTAVHVALSCHAGI